ncbi:unnamed protein product [Prorocentrum cordatum]|uniref:Uncharacterized protein n=1 Tax=Prorocentrum cordatum TaxID=2364126 RepID=A0ABN9XKQ8_9DINO|nr:unnamed protein product [Polarella glacialis]
MSGPLQKHVSAAGAPEAASPRRRRAMPSGGGGGCDPAAGAPCQGAAAALGAEAAFKPSAAFGDTILRRPSAAVGGVSGGFGAEDHDLRQFWNAPGTQRCFVELCRLGRADGPVALLSAPSVFFAGKAWGLRAGSLMEAFQAGLTQKSAWLLEFDRRWEPGNEHFVFFDYREPAASLPGHLLGRCGMVLADPPHINQWAAAELGAFPAAFVPKQSAAWAELGRCR